MPPPLLSPTILHHPTISSPLPTFLFQFTFPSPVCITGVSVGAVPGSLSQSTATFAIFAKDFTACGASRFVCLYEGLQQPLVGVATATMPHPFVTDYLIIRGTYQTAPITLHGYALDKAGLNHSLHHKTPQITLEAAGPHFTDILLSLPTQDDYDTSAVTTTSTKDDDKTARAIRNIPSILRSLRKHWRRVGSALGPCISTPLSQDLVKDAIKSCEAVCRTLASSSSNTSIAALVARNQHVQDTVEEQTELLDMVMGWMGFLADLPVPMSVILSSVASSSSSGTPRKEKERIKLGVEQVMTFGNIGLAATVLVLYSHPSISSSFLSRYGNVLLAYALRSSKDDGVSVPPPAPSPPTSQWRHASAAVLLLIHGAGVLACEALSGWWRPPNGFIQWRETSSGGGDKDDERKEDRRQKNDERREQSIPQVDGTGDDAWYGGGDAGTTKGKKKRRVDGDDKRKDTVKRKDGRGDGDQKNPSSERPARDLREEIEHRRREKEREKDRDKDRDTSRSRKERNTHASSSLSSRGKEKEEGEYLRAFALHWDKEIEKYSGLYTIFVTAIEKRVLAPSLADLIAPCLRILRFYQHVVSFSATAEGLICQHLPSQRWPVPSEEATMAAATCGGALLSIARALLHSSPPCPLYFELLHSRRVLSLLPALLIVPATHKARCIEDGEDPDIAAMADQAMSNQLSLGLRSLLVGVTASVAGLRAVAEDEVAIELLRLLRFPPIHPTISSALHPLGNLSIAITAVCDLCDAPVTSAAFASAAITIRRFLRKGDPSERLLIVHAVGLDPRTLWKCVEIVQTRAMMLCAANGQANAAVGVGAIQAEFGSLVSALPILQIGEQILEAWIKEAPKHAHKITDNSKKDVLTSYMSSLLSIAQSLMGCASSGAMHTLSSLQYIIGGLEVLTGSSTTTTASTTIASSFLACNLPPLPHTALLPFTSASVTAADKEQTTTTMQFVDWEDVREFWDHPQRRGQVEIGLRFLTARMVRETDQGWAHMQHKKKVGMKVGSGGAATTGGLFATATAVEALDEGLLMLRALATAVEIVSGASADLQWIGRVGAAIDPVASSISKRAALEFMDAVAGTAAAYSLQARHAGCHVDSWALVAMLVEAHALACADESSLLTMMGQAASAPSAAAANSARCHLAAALRCWLPPKDSSLYPIWTPPLLPPLLRGSAEVMKTSFCSFPTFSPRQLFSAMAALGDLAPEEWPPADHRRAFNPPPSLRTVRWQIATAVDASKGEVSRVLGHCIASQSSMVRAATTRWLARAGGCGGPMGKFVLGPLEVALQTAVASDVPANDARIVLEVLVPLVYRPALKAAMLDVGMRIPRLLVQVVEVMLTGVPITAADLTATATVTTPTVTTLTAAAVTNIDPIDASAVCTMVFECLTVLCNPDYALDPGVEREKIELEDVPSVADCCAIAMVLLRRMDVLGDNMSLGHRILHLLASTIPGRAGLRRAVVNLYIASSGEAMPDDAQEELSVQQLAEGAKWMATRYWNLSQGEGIPSEIAQEFHNVADLMKMLLGKMEEDGPEPGPSPPVATRIADAVVAAVASDPVTARGSGETYGFTGRCSSTVTGNTTTTDSTMVPIEFGGNVYDPVTRMYWKNLRARAVPLSAVASSAIARKFVRRDCIPDEYVTVVDILHMPLTHPLRPLNEDMLGEGEGGAGDVVMTEGDGPPSGDEQQQQVVKEQEQEEGGQQPLLMMPTITTTADVVSVVPLPAAPPIIVPVAASGADDFDLYADLGPDLGMLGGGGGGGEPLGVAVAPVVDVDVEKPKEEVNEEELKKEEEMLPAVAATTAPPPTTTVEVKEMKEVAATSLDTVSAPVKEEIPEPVVVPPQPQPPPSSSAEMTATAPSEVATLLNDPAAMQALLQDPKRLQELLVKNPALMAVLKKKLGGGK